MGNYLLLVIVLISIGWLGITVFRNNPQNPSNRSFAFLLAWTSFWSVLNFIEGEIQSQYWLTIVFRLDFASAAWIAFYFLLFCLQFPFPSYKKIPKALIVVPTLVVFLASFSPFVVKEAIFTGINEQPGFKIGPLFWLYLPIVGGYIFSGIFMMLRKWLKSKGLARAQATYILLGMGVSGATAIVVNLGISSFFPISTTTSRIPIYVFLALAWLPGYAIIRYRLMDIRIFIRETAAYFLTAGVLGVGTAVIVGIITNDPASSAFIFCLCLAVPYLQQRASQWLDDQKVRRGMISTEGRNISSISDRIKNAGYKLSDLGDTVTQIILDEIPASKCLMLIFDPDNNVFKLEAQAGLKDKFFPAIPAKDALVGYLEKTKSILIKAEGEKYLDDEIRESILKAFSEREIEVVIPLVVLGRIAGLLVLSQKVNNQPYFVHEVNYLNLVAVETATALRYVLAVSRAASETKRWAHSLNQSLKPLSQAFEFLQMDDPRASTDQEREEVFAIIWRSMKKLGGFLHYLTHQSRIIDEELRNNYEHLPLDIKEIVDKSLGTQKLSAQKKGVSLTAQVIADGVSISGHKRDLVAVIEAILSNAMRYVTPQGEIRVLAKRNDSMFRIAISNSGPPIPVNLLEEIFIEGFQIKDGLEGTGGLGLANARRIIGMHNGKIWAENLPDDKGVVFIVELPIALESELVAV